MEYQNESLSVIIPCHNEEQLLPHCLERLKAQIEELGPQGEILIAINGSSDQSYAIAKAFAARHRRVVVIHLHEADKKKAMNAALKKATNRYVLFCDADSLLDLDAISQLKAMFSKKQYAIVGSIRRPIVDERKVNRAFPETYFMLHYAKRLSLSDRLSIQGWFMGIDRSRFDHLTFPDDASADDIWLSAYTWTTLGPEAIGYIDHAIGSYVPPNNLADMRRQLTRHRSNHMTVRNSHPRLKTYFAARNNYYTKITIDPEWRKAALSLGVDFDTWISKYKRFVHSVDKSVKQHAFHEGHTWDVATSSKSLPQIK